jgi:hypothetical protein
MTGLLLLLVLIALWAPAWGPGTHLEFAHRVLRSRRSHLPRSVARLIREERPAFLYGNLAADIINFKSVGGPYSHCHRWQIIEAMRADVKSNAQEAFVLGYLSHLAADTIAHNNFVPYHLARYARLKGTSHLYWEMMADRFVPDERWRVVGGLKRDSDLYELDDLVNRAVPRKALSMGTNKVLFNHVLLVSERETWRKGMARLQPIEKVRLTRVFLDLFRDAAVERILLALGPGGLEAISVVDANGKEAQQKAMTARGGHLTRWMPQMMRNGNSAAADEAAAVFLEGMQSPPPRARAG